MQSRKALAVMISVLAMSAVACHGLDESNPEMALAQLGVVTDAALDQIEAEPAQREAIHAIKAKLFENGREFRAIGKGVRERLVTQWRSEQPNRDEMRAEVDVLAESIRAMGYAAIDASLEVHGTLSPAQREQLAELVAQHAFKRGPRDGVRGKKGKGQRGMRSHAARGADGEGVVGQGKGQRGKRAGSRGGADCDGSGAGKGQGPGLGIGPRDGQGQE